MSALKYPIGIQDFATIRQGDYVYADKTALVYRLVNRGKYYFLSRPRRFGKSLLLSTLHAYFDGQKELFDGLAIDRLESQWICRPVFHIDFNMGQYDTGQGLYAILEYYLKQWEGVYGRDDVESTYALRFAGVIKRAFSLTGLRPAILIDEYDKPLLEAIGNSGMQEQLRTDLRSFYSVLKSEDRNIQFAMLTGVTKFGRLSVFSGLNNLNDITFNPHYAAICGLTKDEMHTHFTDGIDDLCARYHLNQNDMVEELKRMYDGYRFTVDETKVFNPYSVLMAFDNTVMRAYWFETGTPKYLVAVLSDHDYTLSRLDGIEVNESDLSSLDIDSLSSPIPLIYQSGYLTIKDFDLSSNSYTLGFPNLEVRHGFMQCLLPYYVEKERTRQAFDISNFVREVSVGDAEGFMSRLKSLTADISYKILADCKNDFQNLLYIIFTLSSLKPIVERHTSDGRIDMIVKTDSYLYIMEFKIDDTAENALKQINDKDYALPFLKDRRTIIKIGASFSKERRRLTDYLIECVNNNI